MCDVSMLLIVCIVVCDRKKLANSLAHLIAASKGCFQIPYVDNEAAAVYVSSLVAAADAVESARSTTNNHRSACFENYSLSKGLVSFPRFSSEEEKRRYNLKLLA